MKTCHACYGNGQVEYHHQDGTSAWHTCKRCDGNGRIQWYRVEIINTAVVGAMCGYGQGPTHEAAVADAIAQTPGSRYDANWDAVLFSEAPQL
jgi:hypothetical protein